MAHSDNLFGDVPSGRKALASLAMSQETSNRGSGLELAASPLELDGPEAREFAQIVAGLDADREMAELMASAARDRPAWKRMRDGVEDLVDGGHAFLVRHSVGALRVTLGAVFLGFGVLKFFPGVSPAENLATTTTNLLTFGLIPAGVAIVAIAALECFIGICLLANRGMRLAVGLLAVELVGILSPAVLLAGRLFSGPHNAPTLEGQYVLKDIILVGAAMVIAASTHKGGRLVRDEAQSVPAATALVSTRSFRHRCR